VSAVEFPYRNAAGFRFGRWLLGLVLLSVASIVDAVPGWNNAADLATARSSHTATVLSSGQVLVAGGIDSLDQEVAAAELYDPARNAWRAAGTLTVPRWVMLQRC
jgi:hypothetical protein